MVLDPTLNVEKTIPMVTPLLEIGLDGNCPYAIRTSLKRDGCELVVFDKNRLEDAPSVLWKQAGYPFRETNSRRNIHPARKIAFPLQERHLCKLCRKATGFAKYGMGKSRQPTT